MFLSSLFDLLHLRKAQWLEIEELEEIQRKKLIAMIKHAYQNVSYYRKLFDAAGIRPEDIKSTEDLPKIPVTTREKFQQLPLQEIIAKGVDVAKCKKATTSGSSGIPLDVYFSERDYRFLELVWLRAYLENGLRLKDKMVRISYPHPIFRKHWFQHLGIWRRKHIPIFKSMREQVAILAKGNFDVLSSYPSNLRLLAGEMNKTRLKEIAPRLIFSTSEFLDKATRDSIVSALGANLFNYYGCWECGLIAWECKEHSGCHINTDCLVIELVNNGVRVKPGQRGQIVCTNLHSYAMPFIRYDTGDVGMKRHEQCPCGRGLPLMDVAIGRRSDLVFMGKGIFSHPAMFDSLMQGRVKENIKQFRIIQKSVDHFVFQIVAEDGYRKIIAEYLRHGCERLFSNPIHLQFKWLLEIPKEKTGKLRIFVSEIESQLGKEGNTNESYSTTCLL